MTKLTVFRNLVLAIGIALLSFAILYFRDEVFPESWFLGATRAATAALLIAIVILLVGFMFPHGVTAAKEFTHDADGNQTKRNPFKIFESYFLIVPKK